MKVLALVLLMAVGTFAQTSATVQGHALGETGAQFLADSTELAGCVKPVRDKALCKDISQIVAGKPKTIDIQSGTVHYSYMFKDGILYKVMTHEWLLDSTFEARLMLLKRKLGEPTSSGSRTLQNSFGATWDVGNARWEMPDGSAVIASELIETSAFGPGRFLDVDYYSRKMRDDVTAGAKPEKNPY